MLAGYEAVQSGLANRIVCMAEDALKAQIDSDMVPIRAEARALILATFAVSFFPWLAISAALILLVQGYETAGIIAGLAGVVSAGPQIIGATRRRPAAPKK